MYVTFVCTYITYIRIHITIKIALTVHVAGRLLPQVFRHVDVRYSVKLPVAMAALTCKLCSELYSDPRMLACLHSFCCQCLMKMTKEQGTSRTALKCPTCNATNQLPNGGCMGLCKNLLLAHEVETESFQRKIKKESSLSCAKCTKSSVTFCCTCSMFLCAPCTEDHQFWKELVGHELINLEQAKGGKTMAPLPCGAKSCPRHPKEALKFYCETCNCLVCRDCMAITHKDCQHDYIERVAKKECDDLRRCLMGTEKALAELDGAFKRGAKTAQLINSRKSLVMKEIEQVFDQLEKAVKERRKAVLDQCEKVTASKIRALLCQMEHLETLRQRIVSANEVAVKSLHTHTPGEMLSTKKLVKNELVRCYSQFEDSFLDTIENGSIATGQLEIKPVTDSISKVGVVFVPVDSSTLVEKGISIPHACVGKEARMAVALNLKASSRNRQPLIQAYDSTTSMKVNVSKIKEGRISLSFLPRQVGLRLVHVKVERERSSCGPFPIWVQEKRCYTSLSVQQTFSVGSVTRGVAVHPNEEVFASNHSDYIQVFNKDGSPKLRIGSSVSGDGKLSRPHGLTLVGDILYVVENSNHKIHKFTTTGQYIGKFGDKGSAHGQFRYPLGICTDNMGHILVADQSNQRVQVINSHDDSFAYSIPCSGDPYDVAVDNAGNVHVALYDSHQIQVFSPDGQQALETYNGNGKIRTPAGIAISPDGHKFIADYSSKCLHVLDPSCMPVACYSGLSGPYAVTIGSRGHVYVADSSSSRILKC